MIEPNALKIIVEDENIYFTQKDPSKVISRELLRDLVREYFSITNTLIVTCFVFDSLDLAIGEKINTLMHTLRANTYKKHKSDFGLYWKIDIHQLEDALQLCMELWSCYEFVGLDFFSLADQEELDRLITFNGYRNEQLKNFNGYAVIYIRDDAYEKVVGVLKSPTLRYPDWYYGIKKTSW
ncbi:hypothetical protein [Chitinophaga sancti]|uniref:Uncharacterized protein n=1 Tax=Chitinophaga sancti TaxID=1004 RepID=A0A1K1S0C9_9BACT|nr:hypothetical protein [Chitinophaga sancti]WQD59781.1 hypothetical protein U0033_17980 [Chitinophaga sancti]WQG88088.1 hypothetical protein SR876_24485 [Chitinophaga sancti]SFW77777.1 hypothetical protein SAMN05661012_04517 [Chitinophaga sancti]